MKIGPLKIFKDKKSFDKYCWVCIDVFGYLYIENSFLGLLWTIATEWRLDKHLAG